MERTKQITRWIIALAGLMIATGAVQAKDYDFKHNGLYYKKIRNINFITSEVKVVPEKANDLSYSDGNAPTGAVTIPESFTRKVGLLIHTYHVTKIGDRAFAGCKALQSIDIPASVTTIGSLTFYGCIALQSIDIPAGVKTIGKGAFSECTALKSVTLHNGLEEIGEGAFNWCTALQSIDIPASVTAIGEEAFEDCKALKSVTLPDGIQEIKKETFGWCTALQSIDIPASVTAIGKEAFWKCTALQSIDIPASVTTIGEGAFKECTALKTVTVHWNTPLAVPDNVFEDVNTDNVTLNVPKGKEAAYKAHAVWGKFKFEGGSTPPPPPPVVQVTSVTLSHHKVTVNGDITQKQLTATVQPAAATNKSLTWKSSDAAVASVDADGLVTIHKKGKATVTATANDGSGHSDACLFDVISTVANETVGSLRIFAADGALHLTLPKAETVHIYHVNGAMVKTLVLPAGDHVLPLPSGVYVVRVGERVTKILIK